MATGASATRQPFKLLNSSEVRNGACVTNAPSEYDGAELYER